MEPDTAEALLLNEQGGFFSEAGWRRKRDRTFRRGEIEPIGFRVLQSSFAQLLKNRGAPIEAVSKARRNSSTATTERFYAHIRTEKAWTDLEQLRETPRLRFS